MSDVHSIRGLCKASHAGAADFVDAEMRPVGSPPLVVALAEKHRAMQPPPGKAPLRTEADLGALPTKEMYDRMDEIDVVLKEAA